MEKHIVAEMIHSSKLIELEARNMVTIQMMHEIRAQSWFSNDNVLNTEI